MHYLLLYDVVDDYVERRKPLRAEHLALAMHAVERGELVLGGALADPVDGSVLLFRSHPAAETFVASDPYVRNGLVTKWRIREWTTVVGTALAPGPGDEEAIRDLSRRWLAAIRAGDLDTAATMLADDVVVVHGDGRTIAGRDAVVADLRQAFERFTVQQMVRSEEMLICGDWGFDRSSIRTVVTPRTKGGEPITSDSRTWTIVRREAGAWKIARTIGVIEASGQG